MSPVLERADAVGAACVYADIAGNGAEYLSEFGFETASTFTFFDVSVCILVRPPQ